MTRMCSGLKAQPCAPTGYFSDSICIMKHYYNSGGTISPERSNNHGHRQHNLGVLYASLNTTAIWRDVCGINSIIVNCVWLCGDVRQRDRWAAVEGLLKVDIPSLYHSGRFLYLITITIFVFVARAFALILPVTCCQLLCFGHYSQESVILQNQLIV